VRGESKERESHGKEQEGHFGNRERARRPHEHHHRSRLRSAQARRNGRGHLSAGDSRRRKPPGQDRGADRSGRQADREAGGELLQGPRGLRADASTDDRQRQVRLRQQRHQRQQLPDAGKRSAERRRRARSLRTGHGIGSGTQGIRSSRSPRSNAP